MYQKAIYELLVLQLELAKLTLDRELASAQDYRVHKNRYQPHLFRLEEKVTTLALKVAIAKQPLETPPISL